VKENSVPDLAWRDIIRLTMPLVAGAKLDGYEIIGLLGAGGMGEVYRVRDPALKREVAIKVLPSFVSHDPDRLHRFEQEAQAAAALNHPNILAVHQFGVFEGAPYLVSELLEGGTLRQVLQRGPLPVRKTIDYAVQIAHGRPMNKALFIATSSRRTFSSPRTAVSKFWISVLRSYCSPSQNRTGTRRR
jgi:serine/threonine protein kinase